MTERKWTPGPWVVEVNETAAQVQGFPCIEATDYTVVGTEGMYGDIETDYANASLIAAAPELYEALQDVIKVCEAAGIILGSCMRAKETLAKARGET